MYAEYRKNGVVGAVVHASNDAMVPEILKNTPVKFAVCAALTPGKQTVAKVEAGIREGRYACMKVYLGYNPRWANDKFYLPFYKLAEKMNVPVVFHTGDTYDKNAFVKYADPLQIDDIALTHPKVKFVIAHMGNPWFQSAAEVVYKDDNVFVDTSALMLGDVGTKDPEVVDELITKPVRWFFTYVENPKKFLFGTDWPLVDVGSYIAALKRAIPKKDWDDVFYKNATEVFPTLKE
jgi:predicted TIM-barrel fold metal-dependent hydrolase